jgi:hypothetical protein
LILYLGYIAAFGDDDENDSMKKWYKMYLIDNPSQIYYAPDLIRSARTAFEPVAIKRLADASLGLWGILISSTIEQDKFFTKQGNIRNLKELLYFFPMGSAVYQMKQDIQNTESIFGTTMNLR